MTGQIRKTGSLLIAEAAGFLVWVEPKHILAEETLGINSRLDLEGEHYKILEEALKARRSVPDMVPRKGIYRQEQGCLLSLSATVLQGIPDYRRECLFIGFSRILPTTVLISPLTASVS